MSQVLGKILGTITGVIVFVLLIALMFGILGILLYSFGWFAGWIIHIFVGPDIIFGISFEQLIGISWLIISFLYIAIRNATKTNSTYMVEQFKNITKRYRGY